MSDWSEWGNVKTSWAQKREAAIARGEVTVRNGEGSR